MKFVKYNRDLITKIRLKENQQKTTKENTITHKKSKEIHNLIQTKISIQQEQLLNENVKENENIINNNINHKAFEDVDYVLLLVLKNKILSTAFEKLLEKNKKTSLWSFWKDTTSFLLILKSMKLLQMKS